MLLFLYNYVDMLKRGFNHYAIRKIPSLDTVHITEKAESIKCISPILNMNQSNFQKHGSLQSTLNKKIHDYT